MVDFIKFAKEKNVEIRIQWFNKPWPSALIVMERWEPRCRFGFMVDNTLYSDCAECDAYIIRRLEDGLKELDRLTKEDNNDQN